MITFDKSKIKIKTIAAYLDVPEEKGVIIEYKGLSDNDDVYLTITKGSLPNTITIDPPYGWDAVCAINPKLMLEGIKVAMKLFNI